MKIIIVGGVAGGASAAARARRLCESAEILLIERGSAPSFANCGMPYYIGGEIQERGKLLVSPLEQLRQRYRLDVRIKHSVESIDRQAKQVTIRNLQSGELTTERYDKLILSPGAAPIRPPLPGIDLPQVHTLRNLEDADRLYQLATTQKSVIVIGGGFIGLEMAENLVRRGLRTTVVEHNRQILPPWDAEMVAPLATLLREHGIDLRLDDSAESFAALPAGGVSVKLKSGAELAADFVVLSVGVRPENQIAQQAGLEIGPRGGIVVNPHQQTTDPDIYAVGDAIQTTDFITGGAAQIPLAGPANRQGRIAADHIFGRSAQYRGAQGTAIVGMFGMTAAMTGLSQKACAQRNIPCETISIHPAHHAGYYPGAEGMSLKLLFAPATGKILGAQVVGGAGVDKRIDVLAVAIQAGMTVYDLEELELAYAPQYGSAKDPLNMAGFVAAGVLRGDQPIVHAPEVAAAVAAGLQLIDVRTPAEFAAGAIPGAINLPVDDLRTRLPDLDPTRPVITYCKVGQRGYMATRILSAAGFQVRNLTGGYTTWRNFERAEPMG